MEKQETKGRNRIVALFDAGTFVEMGAYVRRRGNKDAYDAVVCGYGAVNGKLTFAFVQDCDRTNGAFDDTGADKVEKLYEQAIRNGAPVIGVFDSAGAVVWDGTPALSAYGRLMKCISDASGIVPQIALISGVCSGMAAMAASLFDLTVTVKDQSELFVNPPSLVGKNTGKAEYAMSNGLSAILADDEAAATAAVRDLITWLPLNNQDSADTDPVDNPNRPADVTGLSGRALIEALADQGEVTVVYGGFAGELVTAFARLGGRLVGVIASDASVNEGKLTVMGARKAAKLISFCDSFGVPILTLVDSTGVELKADPEQAAAFGKLAAAYLTATCAKISVVTGKAYGSAFTLLGSRALRSDLALALPEAVISIMDPESAVAFIWNDKIGAEKGRDAVETEWKETYASPTCAAEAGDIDDIVPADELRQRLCAAVYMLAGKADSTPDRKHGNLPL